MRENALTKEFSEATSEICLPVMVLKHAVESPEFRKQLIEIMPSSYTIKPDVISVRNGDVCAPYRVVREGGVGQVSICQDMHKNIRCDVWAHTNPMSLKEYKYLRSISDFSDWKFGKPNRNRARGEMQTPFSQYGCRPNILVDDVNAVIITQNSSLWNVGVTLHEADCSKLTRYTR